MEAAQTAPGGSGDDGPGGADASNDHAITITRDRTGTTVTIAVDRAAADDPTFSAGHEPGRRAHHAGAHDGRGQPAAA